MTSRADAGVVQGLVGRIDGAAAGKDEPAAFRRRFQQVHRADDIGGDGKVGLPLAFGNVVHGREVHDDVRRKTAHGGGNRLGIAQVDLLQEDGAPILPAQAAGAETQRIEHANRMVVIKKPGKRPPDITGASGDKNALLHLCPTTGANGQNSTTAYSSYIFPPRYNRCHG